MSRPVSTIDRNRLLRKLTELYRHKHALEVILSEIRSLYQKYRDDPSVLEYLLKVENFLQQQLDKVLYGINVQTKKAKELGLI